MISSIDVVFVSTLNSVWPRSNSKTHRFAVANEEADSFNTLIIFVWASVLDKSSRAKNFITALYYVHVKDEILKW